MTKVKKAIVYWITYWKDLVKDLIDSNRFNTTIDSPRFLFDDIITEIEYNSFGNSDNRKAFKERLSAWNQKDKIFCSKYKSQIAILFNCFEKEKSQYLLTLAKQVKESIDNGEYYKELIAELVSIIDSVESIDYEFKKKINLYSSLLISEFIAKGFALKDIAGFVSSVDEIARAEDGQVLFAPPTYKELDVANFESTEKYYDEIKSILDNRTAEEYVRNLDTYYYKKPIDCYALVELKGIKGLIDINIGEVNIYSPKLKQYTSDPNRFSEIEKITPERHKVLAAIPIQHISINTSIDGAIAKLNTIIDFLHLYIDMDSAISFHNTPIVIVTKDKLGVCAKGLSCNRSKDNSHKEYIEYIRAIDFDQIKDSLEDNKDKFIHLNAKGTSKTETQLSNAIHWYNKSLVADNKEDKLLFSWIAIESVFKFNNEIFANITCNKNKSYQINAIQKIGASLVAKRFFLHNRHNAFYHLYGSKKTENTYGIPEHLMIKASLRLDPGEKINYTNFLNHLTILADSINTDNEFRFGHYELVKNYLYEVSEYYQNKNSAIDNKYREAENDILMIYRLRNLIVHNAVHPIYSISLYAYKAQIICGDIIRCLVYEYQQSHNRLDQILIKISSEYDIFYNNFEDHLKRLKEV